MKIYTKTGDQGDTSLLGGKRVPKNHTQIESYGTVDELNAQLGICATLAQPQHLQNIQEILLTLQHHLFIAGTQLCQTPNYSQKENMPQLTPQHLQQLEQWIDQTQEKLPPLRHFILPGGSPLAAQLHLARCVCRRAERRILSFLQQSQTPLPLLLTYFNRLSDLLFVLARFANQLENTPEIPWKKE
ncbi:MAG: cob(I)yrinic acid a,c-diamide adenosyltransferase [Planctomycetota bacterium]|nr:MAG: cob(I)yrinic acid a,c-diamide adenosyltransferase [Planctomycetota bacterium]